MVGLFHVNRNSVVHCELMLHLAFYVFSNVSVIYGNWILTFDFFTLKKCLFTLFEGLSSIWSAGHMLGLR